MPLLPHDPIYVTIEEYYAIAFSIALFGLLVTMTILFPAPHEREEYDDEDEF